MDARPTTRAQSPARSSAPGAAAKLCLRATLEALILTLLAALLGRRRHTSAWRHAASHLPAEIPFPTHAPIPSPHARTASDDTHLACESPILYVLGPGPNHGLRPHPRPLPIAQPRIARAPPRALIRPHAPIRAKPPPTGGRSRTPRALPLRNQPAQRRRHLPGH